MPGFQITNEQLGELQGKVAILTGMHLTLFSLSKTNYCGTDQLRSMTGASSGIGLATLLLFTQLGATVINADLVPPREKARNSIFVKTDVTKWSDLKSLFHDTVNEYGRVDIVFANAGT